MARIAVRPGDDSGFLIGSAEAAQILGVSRNTFLSWVARGHIPLARRLFTHQRPPRFVYRADVVGFTKTKTYATLISLRRSPGRPRGWVPPVPPVPPVPDEADRL